MTTATAELVALALHRGRRDTLVSAIIEATDRSMPPEMTTIAWAIAAKASGSTADRQTLDLDRP